MINNIVSLLQSDLNSLGVFDIIGGISKPTPFGSGTGRRILPFDCNSSLDDCKNGTELQPSDKVKMLGFFEQIGDINENEILKKQSKFKSKIRFNVWYNCNSITVQNNGIDINCCDKKGFIQESVLNTIKNTDLTNTLFSYSNLSNYTIKDYEWNNYTINDRFKYHPYYAFSIEIDLEFILNKNCADSIDITLIKELC